MPGSLQQTVILAKLEATSGTDSAPTNTADAVAIRVSGLSVKVDQQFADRDVIIGALAGADKLPYTRRATVAFSVELQSSGTLGTAPAWGRLLQACGMSETITATTRVDYATASTGLRTLTIWAYINGRLEKYNFCTGTFTVNLKAGEVPSLDFTFTGLVSSVAAGAAPTPTLTAWIRPVAVGPTNTTQVTVGGTYSAGAVTGGTGYNFQEFTLDAANDVQDLVLVSQESVGIYGRAPTARCILDLTGAQHSAFMADMAAGTTRSISVTHGVGAGNRVLVHAPAMTLTGVTDNVNGSVLLSEMQGVLRPTSAGNDDFRIVAI